MDGSWLAQSLFSRSVWELIGIFGGGSVIGYLKAKKPVLAQPILYGIATVACLGVIFFTLTGNSILSKPQIQIDANNVEDNIRTWTSSLGLACQPISLQDASFAYKVTLSNGTSVVVARYPKQRPNYLVFGGEVTIAPVHRAAFAALNEQQADEVTDELALDLARLVIGQKFNGSDSRHLESVSLLKGVTLGALSESTFATTLDEMDSSGE